MKCFVASAFGHQDVDVIFNRCIRPVLREFGITPQRVDNVQHNDDIDNKIYELIDLADIVIADLTYARPSVYFEAGLATGSGKPVIYIARGDHLKPRADDPHGVLRIHFDLQMKNIIPWTSAKKTFIKRLKARVRYVIHHDLPKRVQTFSTDRATFGRMSFHTQINTLSKIALNLFRHHGYQLVRDEDDIMSPIESIQNFSKVTTRRQTKLSIRCLESITTSALQNIVYYGEPVRDVPNKTVQHELHYFLISLRNTPEKRLSSGLFSFEKLDTFEYRLELPPNARGEVRNTYVHVINNVKSLPEFRAEVKSLIQNNHLGKGS